jgi:hypothetical protein
MKQLILALGHKARHGKGEFAVAIKGNHADVAVLSFAGPLRDEVSKAAEEAFYRKFPVEAPFEGAMGLRLLCDEVGVTYDPEAIADEAYPWGKQRALLQHWGTEYRRSQDPDYWLKRMKQNISECTAKIIVIDDLRFPNEFDFIGSLGGIRIKITRLGYTASNSNHYSDKALNDFIFDLEIGISEGKVDLLRGLALTTLNYYLGTKECGILYL